VSVVGISAPAGQELKQSPQPVHFVATMVGSGGPPRRGAKLIACSPQVSAQDWQWMKRRARHASVMATRASGRVRLRTNNERRVAVLVI
jgi:hypothetical protein